MDLVFLISSGLCEVLLVYCIKKSVGFTNKLWSLITLLVAATSLTLLSMAMRTTEAGTAYSIWVAIGSVGSLLLGAFLFKEHLSKKQIFYLILIIISVIGLKIS
ncbi:multidrug efflux SMR transporter [Clostridium sp. Ade.TY]|uniref:DMT family transporter n=1 Tax=Clostridium sp. Ade.TY TaxID=1391647 RepID=UPI0003FF50F6|nr:multidrug efflux SMR transporter [Clostridium sp. Ade.TY]